MHLTAQVRIRCRVNGYLHSVSELFASYGVHQRLVRFAWVHLLQLLETVMHMHVHEGLTIAPEPSNLLDLIVTPLFEQHQFFALLKVKIQTVGRRGPVALRVEATVEV